MRIEPLRTLVAVVLLTALVCPRVTAAAANNNNNNNLTLPGTYNSRKARQGHVSHQWEAEQVEALKRPGVLTYREIQNLLRREGGEEGSPVECCPTVEELVEPFGGKNREERYVELYRNGDNKQVFYEYSCRPDVLDQPCRFVDRKLNDQSRCVQKFSYAYALVKDTRSKSNHNKQQQQQRNGTNEQQHRHRHGRTPDSVLPDLSTITTPGTNWSLDYIQVRSGCSCVFLPKQKKKKSMAVPHRTAKKTKSRWRTD